MRRYILAAVAATAIASPAAARDNSGYVGIEGGLWMAQEVSLDTHIGVASPQQDFDDGLTVKPKAGFDGDLVGGYDFGMFRLEGELGYKTASIDNIVVDTTFGANVANLLDTNLANVDFDSGHLSVLS